MVCPLIPCRGKGGPSWLAEAADEEGSSYVEVDDDKALQKMIDSQLSRADQVGGHIDGEGHGRAGDLAAQWRHASHACCFYCMAVMVSSSWSSAEWIAASAMHSGA
jgi:hypothetical protein